MEYVLDGDRLVLKSIDGPILISTNVMELVTGPENEHRLKLIGTFPDGQSITTLGVYEFLHADGQTNNPLRVKFNLSSGPNYPKSIDEKGETLTQVVQEKLPESDKAVSERSPASGPKSGSYR